MTNRGRRSNPRFRRQFLSSVSKLAELMCAPFWWSVATPADTRARILHNATICYVNTGSRHIGITANHVYKKYLTDEEAHGAKAIECQFGSSTIYPEKHIIDYCEKRDLATFVVIEGFVGTSNDNPKSHHNALRWPPHRAQKSEVVMYGGYPGELREDKGHIAELPFQWVAGHVNDVGEEHILLEPSFMTMDWHGPETNDKLGGWSGGPVFRVVEEPITRLELIGIITHSLQDQAVFATHADAIRSDGTLRLDTWTSGLAAQASR